MNPSSRRSFLARAALSAAALAAPSPRASAEPPSAAQPATPNPALLDLTRPPDLASAFLEADTQPISLHRSANSWQASGIELRTTPQASSLDLSITAPVVPLKRIHLRWSTPVDTSALYLGDAWERSYGDLAWRSIVPERVMPWYFAAHSGNATHGYGVRTGARALCFWQVDPEGVSLWLDLSNGGGGVLLGQRELAAATIVSRPGHPGELPSDAIAGLCRLMCPHPRLPSGPVYGANDWYYAYGRNSAAGILRDTDLIASLSPRSGPRPFSVIDGGWEPDSTPAGQTGVNPAFPDMTALATQIRGRGVRPGIWIRPTQAPTKTRPSLLLPNSRFHNATASDSFAALDPTIPESLDLILAKVAEVVAWSYDLVKFDYSTYDLLGQWGFDMGPSLTRPGWSFHDRSRTNAEILLALYQSIRSTAGDKTLLLGCNTVGHLGAGLFDLQRTGDDTSGRQWERTRRMGINTLAFRLPQNRTFFLIDADCVGITRNIPWELNRQWMDLLARSGSALFLSPSPDSIGPPRSDQRRSIAEAFAIAAAGNSTGYPTDSLRETTPSNWQFTTSSGNSSPVSKTYSWCGPDGCNPFLI